MGSCKYSHDRNGSHNHPATTLGHRSCRPQAYFPLNPRLDSSHGLPAPPQVLLKCSVLCLSLFMYCTGYLVSTSFASCVLILSSSFDIEDPSARESNKSVIILVTATSVVRPPANDGFRERVVGAHISPPNGQQRLKSACPPHCIILIISHVVPIQLVL